MLSEDSPVVADPATLDDEDPEETHSSSNLGSLNRERRQFNILGGYAIVISEPSFMYLKPLFGHRGDD